MPRLPAISMVKLLAGYAYANKLPIDIRRWESIVRVYLHYSKHTKYLN